MRLVFFKILFMVFFLLPSLAYAGQLEDGQTALNEGDYQTAMKLLEPLADQGNAEAQFQLALMYKMGTSLKRTDGEAFRWFRRAAIQAEISDGGVKALTERDLPANQKAAALLLMAEWREAVKNREVCAQLEKAGDSLTQPREIDHWIYFDETAQREKFRKRSVEMGFQTIKETDTPDHEKRYGIRINRVDLPSYDGIDTVTLPLFRLALEFEGEYDGWETEVIRSKK
ncbi:MAG: ribonuclease E inhibitor RraB [Alphaproteobacteria bacterium]